MKLLRLLWRLSGGRKIKAFGHEFLVTHNTIFPSYRKLRLPKGSHLSEIVKYADYVQIHAVCNFLSGLKKRPVIIDIGAHHGAYAVLIGRIVRHLQGKVIAVEPNPKSFEILMNNVRLNCLEEVVICEPSAVSDSPKWMNISMKGTESQITVHVLDANVPVEVVTLRSLLDKHKVNAVDLLMVDVEGAELPVLRSFPWQTATVEKIFCELHPYAWKNFGYGGDDMRSFLTSRKYRCIDMYMKEHATFEGESYIGPTVFLTSSHDKPVKV